MWKMAFKDGKAKLVTVAVDLANDIMFWSPAGKSGKELLEVSAMQEMAWMSPPTSHKVEETENSTKSSAAPVDRRNSSKYRSSFSPNQKQLRSVGRKSFVRLEAITGIHFGSCTTNMLSSVNQKYLQYPWRCWSIEVELPKPRTYDFVTLGDEDAQYFVMGLLSNKLCLRFVVN